MGLIRKLSELISKPETMADKPAVVPRHALSRLSVTGPIPQDVLQLLWFLDGPLKNHVPVENSTSFEAGPVVVTIRFGPSEPSAISTQLPVSTKAVDWNSVPDPSYYPSYESLTPEQQHKYLTWLTNVERDVQIGYVFIFYYGLEHHLFFGRVDEAFNMVLRLRRTHLNRSFQHYSESALIASAMFHNKPDLFIRYVEAASNAEAPEVSNLYLLAKAALNIPLAPEEIMSASRNAGFTKQRYITGNPELFKAVLGDLLEREYGQRFLPLSQFPVAEWPRAPEIIVANISFPQEQRTIPVPHLLESDRFRQSITALLQTAHDTVKTRLKEQPKSMAMPIAKPLEQINQPVERPRLREGYALFPALDDTRFDRNVECYSKDVCPYCDKPLPRRPEQAMKCPSCGNRIRTRNNFLKGQKGFFREDETTILNAVAEERARRNFICDAMDGQQISVRDIRAIQGRRNCTLEEALIEAVAGKAAEHQRNRDMGLCRNSLLSSGQVYMRIGDKAKALARFLQVAFYDVNGCTNAGGIPGSPKFDLRFGDSVAPAILAWISDLADERRLANIQLRDLFINAANSIYERGMPHPPEQAWDVVSQQLCQEE